jgi:hypothetical protein
VVVLCFMGINSDWAATCAAFVDVFDQVLVPIRQERYPDGIGYCSSSMECPRIFLSLVGRDLNRKLAHKLFGTDDPDMALSALSTLSLAGRHDCTTWPHST